MSSKRKKILTFFALSAVFMHNLPILANMMILFRDSDRRSPKRDGSRERVVQSGAVFRTDERSPTFSVRNIQVGDRVRLFSGKKCNGPVIGDYNVNELNKYRSFNFRVRNPLPYTTKRWTKGKRSGQIIWDHYSSGIVKNNTVKCIGTVQYGLVLPKEFNADNPSFNPRTSRPNIRIIYRGISGGSKSMASLAKDTTVTGSNYPIPHLSLGGVPTRTPFTFYNKSNCSGEVTLGGQHIVKRDRPIRAYSLYHLC